LSDEFQLINLELRAGKHRKDALKNLALRTNLEEINSLVTLLIQTDQFGTSLADALRVYADSFRTQRYQRAEEKAAKLPVKLIIPLVLFIFPALFVVLLGPAAISIYNTLLKP
jgi:tight adherence protein C